MEKNKQLEALRLADELENDEWIAHTKQWRDEAATELRRLHETNQELLRALQTILNTSLMDKGHWAKTIEAEAHAAIAKATGEQGG